MTDLGQSVGARTGRATVWIGDEPEDGSHSWIRGEITADAIGVHVGRDATYRWYDPGEWDRGEDEWSWESGEATIPWHRVNQINWEEG